MGPLGNQPFTATGAYFLFLADPHRHAQIAERMGEDVSGSMGTADTALKGAIERASMLRRIAMYANLPGRDLLQRVRMTSSHGRVTPIVGSYPESRERRSERSCR